MTRSERQFDVVVYGATGFVGRLTAAYLANHAPSGTRVALAGRSATRLGEVRAALGPAAGDWPIIVADSGDARALAELATSTRVVATTVGPYARYGSDLVAACAEAGTDYADLTGEVLFVRDCIERYGKQASSSGARIVNACGYDSIPSDLGVLALHQLVSSDGTGELADVVMNAKARGGFSGGTIDSMRAQMEALSHQKSLRSVLLDPYALSPERSSEADLGSQPDMFPPRRDPLTAEWSAPFIMGSYNTRIVRRSNALNGWAYGRNLRYREIMGFGTKPSGALAAAGITAGLGVSVAAMAFAPTRRGLSRVLPKPGAGPSQQTMDRGWFRCEFSARTTTGARYKAVVSASGDPGYKATAVMLGESALALSLDRDRLPDAAGVLTPATAIGAQLIERLRLAGFTIEAQKVSV